MADINGRWQNDPVLGKGFYGALVVLGVGVDGAVWYRWQIRPNGPWGGDWGRLPDEFVPSITWHEPAIFDPITSRPSVVLNESRLWVFLRSARGRILYIRQDSTESGWSDWRSIGGIVEGGDPVVGNPVAVSSNNRILIFARGRDGDLLSKFQRSPGADEWEGWTSWGGLLSGDPCPISDAAASRQLLVYVRGLDQQIWVKGRTVSPSANIAWTLLNCPGDTGSLLSGSPVPGPTFVAWRGIDGRYRIKEQISSTSGIPHSPCQVEEFAMAGDPVHYVHPNGRRDIFWRAPDGGLMHRFRSTSGSWTGPLRIAEGMLGQPIVNTSEDGRVEIIYRRGRSGELFHIFQTVRYGAFSS